MKNALTLAVLVAAFLVACPVRAQVSFGDASKFNDGWLFRLTDDSTIVNPTFDDTQWRKLTLPHDWSIEGQLSPSLASCTGYLPGGIAWYRKHFKITDDAARHYIYFEGVYNRSEVYLNGHLLGKRPNGYISFLYDMTPYLKEGDNVLSVRVDHSRYADSRWYTGSGIYRDVWIIAAPEIHLAQWGTGWYATSLTDRQATIAVDMEVQKHIATREKLELSATLYDAVGKQVAQRRTRVSDGKEGITKETLTLKVTKPHRWNLNDPYLYTLKAELSFIVSATAMIPQSLSSAAKNRGVFPSFENSTAFARISSDTFTNLLTKARFPAFIILPASIAVRPFPTTALKSVTSATAISSVLARSIMAFASGCSLLASTDAAIARSAPA